MTTWIWQLCPQQQWIPQQHSGGVGIQITTPLGYLLVPHLQPHLRWSPTGPTVAYHNLPPTIQTGWIYISWEGPLYIFRYGKLWTPTSIHSLRSHTSTTYSEPIQPTMSSSSHRSTTWTSGSHQSPSPESPLWYWTSASSSRPPGLWNSHW